MIRPIAIFALTVLSVPAFAQFGGLGGGFGGGGFGGGGAGGGQRGNLGQGGNFGRAGQGQGGNFGQAGNRGQGQGQGGGQFGNRVQGKSLFPEGVAVYGYDADNSIIIASGLTRTADGRLIHDNIEAIYGYDVDNSVIIKSSGSSRQAMLDFLGSKMDKQFASLLDTPVASKGGKAAGAPRISVVLRLAGLPAGALPRLHRLGFESTGAVSKMSIPGTLPQTRLAIAAIQPFVKKIESAN